MRTRMSGRVAGESGRPLPLCRSWRWLSCALAGISSVLAPVPLASAAVKEMGTRAQDNREVAGRRQLRQRRRPGGSAGEGMAADFPLLEELAVTCTGAGWGMPAPAFNSRWSL